MKATKTGGPFAIAGFVYQFLNTIDQGLAASLRCEPGEDAILILEPANADAARHGMDPQIIQYKTRSTGPWPVHKVLFDVLPGLLRAGLDAPAIPYAPTFVTSASVRNAVALRACLAGFATEDVGEPLRIGRTWMTPAQILTALATRTARNSTEAGAPEHIQRLRALLSRVRLEENITATGVRKRVLASLRRVAGSDRLATRAYNALFTFIAGRSQEPAARISAREFLEAAGLTPERLAPIFAFDRRVNELTRSALQRRGYDRHRDVRPLRFSGDSSVLLVEGDSGSGKSWSLASLAVHELRRGGLALWVDQVETVEALESEVVRQLWQSALCRSDPTSLPNVLEDVHDILGRDQVQPTLIVLDRLPSVPSERNRLVKLPWARFGFRLAVAVSAAEAADIQEAASAPVIHVGDLTQVQLRGLLERHGISWPSMPADIRKWIARPVLAGIYVELADRTGDWSGTSEYALLDRFAERARQRGDARDIHGCRKLIASFGRDALSHPPPLDARRLDHPPSPAKVRVLTDTGWLQRDAEGELIFAHDRLRDWAIAEHLVRQVEDPAELATRLAGLAGYGAEGVTQFPFRAGYPLMDGIWLLSRRPDGADRLSRFLDGLDGDSVAWNLREDLYGELLPTGGSDLLDAILPAIRKRLVSSPSEQNAWHARRCVEGFARAAQGSAAAILSLIQSDTPEEQRCGCILAAGNPNSRFLERITSLHRIASQESSEGGDESRGLQRSAWRALHQCLLRAPGWLTARLDRAAPHYSCEGHLLSLLAKLPEGRALWQRHGPALVARFEKDAQDRYWLCRCIEAFEDRRFDRQLARWCTNPTGMAALRAWAQLCRHRPDLAAEVAPKLPPGIFSWNTSKWLPPLFEPKANVALEAVLEVLKRQDETGCHFAFTLTGHADALGDNNLAWALARLDDALVAKEPRDLTANRLLDFFASIDEPAAIERLAGLAPRTLPARLLELIKSRLSSGGLWHDPELEGAVNLIHRLAPEHGAAAMRARLRAPHPTLRWMAVREAGFADVARLRRELEEIANAGDEEKEPGRLEAVEVLAEHDPHWAHARIRRKLDEATPSARNEAFWIAKRVSGNNYVDDAVALLPRVFEGPPLYRVVDYLVSRRAALHEVSQFLSEAVAQRPDDRGWIIDLLLRLGRPEADQAVRDLLLGEGDRMGEAGVAFWGMTRSPEDECWRALARRAMAVAETQSLRHVGGFYEAAALLGDGPAYDQLLSDAYPANPGNWGRALNAIRALGKADVVSAKDALLRLCGLFDPDDRDVHKFAEAAARLRLSGRRLAILRGGAHWPAQALLLALEPDGQDYELELVTAVEEDLRSPESSRRRAAAICAPLVLGSAPEGLVADTEEEVREAAREATIFFAQRSRAKRLLADMASAPPERSRRAAAALFAIAARSKPDRTPLIFSWAEFAIAAPRGSGLRFAIPN